MQELSDDDEDYEEQSDDTNSAYVETFERKIIDKEVEKQLKESRSELKAVQEEVLKQKLAEQKKRLFGEIKLELLETLSNIEASVEFDEPEAKPDVQADQEEPPIIHYCTEDDIMPYENTTTEENVPKSNRRGRAKKPTEVIEDFQLVDFTVQDGDAADTTTIVVKNGLNYDCPKCDRRFHTPEEMEKHRQNHQISRNECDICGKGFSTTGVLARHQKIHSEEKNWKCTHCDKSFNQKGSLLRHSLVHSDMKPFTCDECDRAFTQRHLLTKHIEMEHSETPVSYRYPCKFCSKVRENYYGFLTHLIRIFASRHSITALD